MEECIAHRESKVLTRITTERSTIIKAVTCRIRTSRCTYLRWIPAFQTTFKSQTHTIQATVATSRGKSATVKILLAVRLVSTSRCPTKAWNLNRIAQNLTTTASTSEECKCRDFKAPETCRLRTSFDDLGEVKCISPSSCSSMCVEKIIEVQ